VLEVTWGDFDSLFWTELRESGVYPMLVECNEEGLVQRRLEFTDQRRNVHVVGCRVRGVQLYLSPDKFRLENSIS
jgi:hypothetical protein